MTRSSRLVAGIALLAVAAACSGGGTATNKLSVSTRAAATASPGASSSSSGLLLDNGITLTKVRMVVRQLSLERDGACPAATPATPATGALVATSDSGGGSGGQGADDGGAKGTDDSPECPGEVKAGPFFVELGPDALSGAVKFAFDAAVPEGTYDELAIRIDTVPVELATDDGLKAMAAAHASIVVDGTLDAGTSGAKDFEFATPVAVTQKREGAITIGAGSNVTLDFDPSGWFGPKGARLDPTDVANQDAIVANIRASLRVLDDDDADGHDDHGTDPSASR